MSEESFKLIKDSLSHHRQTATLVKQTVPTQQEVDELFHERITPETDLPPMQPLFRMFDVPCFYRGELVADCGKAKSGKTYFLSILMAACLTQKALVLERIIHTVTMFADANGHVRLLRHRSRGLRAPCREAPPRCFS